MTASKRAAAERQAFNTLVRPAYLIQELHSPLAEKTRTFMPSKTSKAAAERAVSSVLRNSDCVYCIYAQVQGSAADILRKALMAVTSGLTSVRARFPSSRARASTLAVLVASGVMYDRDAHFGDV